MKKHLVIDMSFFTVSFSRFAPSRVNQGVSHLGGNFGAEKKYFSPPPPPKIGRTPKGAYSTRGRSGHLLEIAFSEPLLRTLLRTLFYCKTHRRPPSQNPSENPLSRTLPRTFSEPFSERCVAVRPLRRAPYQIPYRHPPGPSAPSSLERHPPPFPGIFNPKLSPPPFPGASDSPFLSPEQRK